MKHRTSRSRAQRGLPWAAVPIAVALGLSPGAGALAGDVDTFETLQGVADGSSDGLAVSNSVSGAGIIGGERDVTVNRVSGGSFSRALVSIDGSLPVRLSFSNDTRGRGHGRRAVGRRRRQPGPESPSGLVWT